MVPWGKVKKVDFFDIQGLIASDNIEVVDERGRVTRFHENHFVGRAFPLKKVIVSNTKYQHTIRGFHIQVEPEGENKLIACLSGQIDEYFLDLRPNSRTFLKYATISLSSKIQKSIYVPRGIAHAFQTLKNDTSILYHIDTTYNEDLNVAINPFDPAIDIPWRHSVSLVSNRDAQGMSLQSFLEKYVTR